MAPTISERGGPDAAATPDFDVVLAGGGLSLIYGAYLARRGLKVAVFDRGVIGCGHREWNISRRELAPLSASGMFSVAEVESLITLSYRAGVCRWHGGGSYPVSGVLDCVVDAEKLLSTLRARAEAAGSGDFTPLWAGQAAGLAREEPAGALTRRLADEAARRLVSLAR